MMDLTISNIIPAAFWLNRLLWMKDYIIIYMVQHSVILKEYYFKISSIILLSFSRDWWWWWCVIVVDSVRLALGRRSRSTFLFRNRSSTFREDDVLLLLHASSTAGSGATVGQSDRECGSFGFRLGSTTSSTVLSKEIRIIGIYVGTNYWINWFKKDVINRLPSSYSDGDSRTSTLSPAVDPDPFLSVTKRWTRSILESRDNCLPLINIPRIRRCLAFKNDKILV